MKNFISIKKLLLIVCITLFYANSYAQTTVVTVVRTDGTSQDYSVSDEYGKLYFDQSNLYISEGTIAAVVPTPIPLSSIRKLVFPAPTAIKTTTEAGCIALYPNPATSELRILNGEFQPNTAVEIFDISGKTVYRQSLNGNSINVSALQAGIYFVRIENQTLKFVKK